MAERAFGKYAYFNSSTVYKHIRRSLVKECVPFRTASFRKTCFAVFGKHWWLWNDQGYIIVGMSFHWVRQTRVQNYFNLWLW
jgi:hypothetical protein